MNKLWAIIRREFLTRVQSRAFVLTTILGPLIMGMLFIMPILLASRNTGPKRIAVVDATTGQAGRRIAEALAAERRGSDSLGPPRYAIQRVETQAHLEAVRDSLVTLTGLKGTEGAPSLDGVLIVTDSALASGRLTYLGDNVGSPQQMRQLEVDLNPVVLATRLEQAGIDPAVVRKASGTVDLETRKVVDGKLTGVSGEASFALAYGISFVLYVALLLYGIQVMHSIIEEKSTRVVEVLISSVTPLQLMLGKVIGVGSAGLLQLGIWIGSAMYITANVGAIAARFGGGSATRGAISLPIISPALLVVFLLFFLLGFYLYSTAYAAIGAMCNSTQEAQQSATVVTMVVAVGFILVFSILGDPQGSLAQVLTFVPFVAPIVVPVRYSIAPLPLPELLGSIGVTIVGMLAVVWLASRIYRVGILSYGKRPDLKTLARWIRAA